ncbi:MAG: TonB family protein [Bacteroidia bacterium]
METNLVLSPSFNELVFEKRHKAYGAYKLRRTYHRRVLSSLLVATASFGLAIGLFFALQQPAQAKMPVFKNEGCVLISVVPDEPKPQEPEPKVEPKQTPPAPKTPVAQPELTVPVVTTQPVITPPPTNNGAGGSPKGQDGGTGSDTTGKVVSNPCIDCPPANPNPTVVEIPTWVEDMPFSDVADAHIRKNTVYPEFERARGKEGTVFIQFIVRKDGTLDDFKVAKGVSPAIDREALRVAKTMPNWNPGKQNGHEVDVICTKPIAFKLK